MKTTKLFAPAAGMTVAAACLFGTLSAADAKVQPAKPAAQPAVAQPKQPKTLAEVFSFMPEVLATIGDRKITKQDFLGRLGNIPPEYIGQLQPEMIKAQSKQWIDMLVNEEVLLLLAEQAGIKSSKEMFMAELDKELKAMPKQQRDLLEKQLQLQNKTIEDLKKEMVNDPNKVRSAVIPKYIETNIMPSIKITDADVEKFYRENQNQFKTPEKVSASHILISTRSDANATVKPDAAAQEKKDKEAKAKAEKILAQLKQGADFAELAKKESDCPSKERGGNLGEFSRGQMVPEFEKAAFALAKKGDISGIVKTDFGYHIIRLEGKTPASVQPLDQANKEQIRNFLKQKSLQDIMKKKIEDAKKVMKVTVAEIK